MLQNKNPPNGRTPRRSKSRLPVPGRSVHEKRVGRTLLSDALCSVRERPPHNDPIVAQNLDWQVPLPPTRSSAFPRPRMSDKKKGLTISPNHTASMQFDAVPQAQVVGNQQFVQRIFQSAARIVRGQALPVENHARMLEVLIHHQTLVRPAAEAFRREIEVKTGPELMCAPQTTRVKKLASQACRDR